MSLWPVLHLETGTFFFCWMLISSSSAGGDDAVQHFYFEKIRVFKAGFLSLNILAWNNIIGLRTYLLVSRSEVMINRDSWGHSYSTVRGEILGFVEDELLRKHLPRMFSLIKNES